MKTFFSFAALLLIASTAHGFGFNDITNWTGSGTNGSALEIDWVDGTTDHALVWGYRWSGSATGESMVEAIAAANPSLTFAYTSYPPFGDFVDEFKFDGSAFGVSSHDQSDFGQAAYWAYYQGTGPTVPTYVSQNNGFTLTPLSNQSWDGWAWEPTYSSTNVPSANPVAAPVPEPTTWVVLGLGALGLLLRRR